MKRQVRETSIKRACLILCGSLFFAVSLALFLTPASIVTGGVSGVAIILDHYLPIGVGALFFLLNLPLLLVGLIKFGRHFMLFTLLATLLSSLFTDILEFAFAKQLPLTSDLFSAALVGGALCGLGLGLVFRADATTGGTDIGVRLLRLSFPNLKPGILFFLIDFTVVVASAIVFRHFSLLLYSTLALLSTSLVLECVLAIGHGK